jgi:hypothetical protein
MSNSASLTPVGGALICSAPAQCPHVDIGPGVLSLLQVSVPFSLPDLKVSSKVSSEVDNHQEVHDSLINSTLKTFSFHLNLSSISFGVSIFIRILIVLLSQEQLLAIARISAQILKQQETIEMENGKWEEIYELTI